MKVFVFLLFVAASTQQEVVSNEVVEVSNKKQSKDVSNEKLSYNLKKPLNLWPLNADKRREIYHYEQTFVIRDSDLDNKVHHCEMIEINDEQEAVNVTAFLSKLNKKKVREVGMGQLMYLLKECDAVDDRVYNLIKGIIVRKYLADSYLQKPLKIVRPKNFASPLALSSKIYPGTKWCGFGDIAITYHDLGISLRNIDRCCRAHDLCPIKVLSNGKRYNLTNNASHTISHCQCDEAFHKCLKDNNSLSAIILGGIYFNAVSECVSGKPENSTTKIQFVPATRKWL